MKNNNQAIARKLTARFLKAGKTCNIITVIAIALTSVMFTSVFTLGGNMLATIQNETMRQVGTSAHGGLKYLTMEQYEHFAQSPLIKDISYNRILSIADNVALQKLQCEIRYSEDKMAKWGFSYPSVGKMPQAENEIACSTIMLDALGVPYEVGATVPLEFTVGGRSYSEIFTLSGYWTGDPVMAAQQTWLSREYVDAVISENMIDEIDHITGTISADVWFSNSLGIENKILRFIEERSYSTDDVLYGVNWAYVTGSTDLDLTSAAVAVLVLALILFSGYLIIYSIFIISVNTDIHFYGLLKTIGTTGRQIRRIIRNQALVLSAIGIPIGLLLGYIAGALLSPSILNFLSVSGGAQTSANPLIFVFSAAFSLLTVFIGCRKPGKIAGRVSPVEAVKYNAVSDQINNKTKKPRKISPLSMAWANVTREKRKLCMIVVSLSLSLILLNSAYSATQSFDMDEYMSKSIISDFAVANYTIFGTGSTSEKNTNGVTADFLREAESRGATEISNVYYHYDFSSVEQGGNVYQIYGVNKATLAYFSDMDYEKLRSGNYAVVSERVISYGDNAPTIPEIGDTLTFPNDNWDGVNRDFEVTALVGEYPMLISTGNMFGNCLTIILAEEVFLDFFGDVQPMRTNIDVNAEDLVGFEAWLESYIQNQNPDLSFISRNTLKAEFDSLRTNYITLGGAMSFILALIGVMNFVNAVTASVIARRRELAMLQSVGMTGKQLQKTLFFEGMCYTALTAFFTLTAGFGLGRLITQVIAGQVWFFKQSFTVMPSIYCVTPLLLICAAVPLICYRNISKVTLVERLREAE